MLFELLCEGPGESDGGSDLFDGGFADAFDGAELAQEGALAFGANARDVVEGGLDDVVERELTLDVIRSRRLVERATEGGTE